MFRSFVSRRIKPSPPLSRIIPITHLNPSRTKSDTSEDRNSWFSNNRVALGILAGAISSVPLYFIVKKYTSSKDIDKPSSSSISVNSSGLPKFVPYILIGGGTASYYAALTIRARDAEAKVLIIGDELDSPYNRPTLSKELWWYGNEDSPKTLGYLSPSGKKRSLFYEVEGFYVLPERLSEREHGAVSFLRGRKVLQVDKVKKEVVLENNERIKFDKCLIATGGKPKMLSVFDKDDLKGSVQLFRGVDDYIKLDSAAKHSNSIAVIGSGFLASELAFSMRKRYHQKGLSVHQIMPEPGNFSTFLPEFLVNYVKNEMNQRGIHIRTNCSVKSAKRLENGRIELILSDESKLIVDHVVIDGVIEPSIEIALKSGLKIDKERGGILADANMQISRDIFCAGDVCSFDDVVLGRRRLEQWEHAQISGRVAGENMTNGSKKYTHQSSFSTILGPNVHFIGVGEVNSRLKTLSVFAEPNKNDPDSLFRGVVFYLRGKRVVGVVLYNVFGMGVEIARKIIAEGKEHGNLQQLAKLFDIYYTEEAREGTESNDEKSEKDALKE